MPIYNYKCLVCNKIVDVLHTINELTKPSTETLNEITCCNTTMIEGWWDNKSNNIVTQDTKNIIKRGN